MQQTLAIGLVIFFALMVVISLWASRRIHSGEDSATDTHHRGPRPLGADDYGYHHGHLVCRRNHPRHGG